MTLCLGCVRRAGKRMPTMATDVRPEFVRAAEDDLHATRSCDCQVSGATCGNSDMPRCTKCRK